MALKRLRAHGLARRPFFDDPMLEILRDRELIHERAYVEHLAKSGKRVVEINKESPTAFDQTLAAMREAQTSSFRLDSSTARGRDGPTSFFASAARVASTIGDTSRSRRSSRRKPAARR
jgi:hypothetical protein